MLLKKRTAAYIKSRVEGKKTDGNDEGASTNGNEEGASTNGNDDDDASTNDNEDELDNEDDALTPPTLETPIEVVPEKVSFRMPPQAGLQALEVGGVSELPCRCHNYNLTPWMCAFLKK